MTQNKKEDLDKIYEQLNKCLDLAKYKISDEILLIYTKRLKENDNNYTNLFLPVSSKELKLLHEDIKSNIEKVKINDYDSKWEDILLLLNEKNNFTAFDAFKYNIRKHVEELFFNYEKDIKKKMKDTLLKTFSEDSHDILEDYKKELSENSKHKSNISNINFDIPYDYLLDIDINKYFSNLWSFDNISFEQRIKRYKDEFINELDQQLFYALIRGDSPKDFSNIVSRIIEKYKADLKVFVITESTYFINIGKVLSYKALGLYKYTIKITEDEKTSQTCKGFKGNIYNIKDYEVGKTAPPFHVNCRSIIESVIDEKDKENLKKFLNKENSYLDKTAVRESIDASFELIQYYKKISKP